MGTPHKHVNEIISWALGHTIQMKCGDEWKDIQYSEPCWAEDTEYRVKPTGPIKFGSFWREHQTGVVYLLMRDYEIAYLASTVNGNVWERGVRVLSLKEVSPEEWKNITGGEKFTPVDNPFQTVA